MSKISELDSNRLLEISGITEKPFGEHDYILELDIPKDYEDNRYMEDYATWPELSDTVKGIADVCDGLIERIDVLVKAAKDIGINECDQDIAKMEEKRGAFTLAMSFIDDMKDVVYDDNDEYDAAYRDVMDKAVEIKEELLDCSFSFDRLNEEVFEKAVTEIARRQKEESPYWADFIRTIAEYGYESEETYLEDGYEPLESFIGDAETMKEYKERLKELKTAEDIVEFLKDLQNSVEGFVYMKEIFQSDAPGNDEYHYIEQALLDTEVYCEKETLEVYIEQAADVVDGLNKLYSDVGGCFVEYMDFAHARAMKEKSEKIKKMDLEDAYRER